nr:zinc finger, CCHC-type [Tanacetum cinerariifolium]
MAAAMKHMASNFAKMKKFKVVDFKRWQKKMHFLFSSTSVVYVLTTPMPEDGGENPTVEQVRRRAKWDNDDYVCRGLILNGMFDSLFDVYQNVKTSKELWDTLEAKYMVEDTSSKKFLDSDKPKGNNVSGPLVNMVEHNNSSRYNDNKGKQKHHDTKADPNKKPKVTFWKCRKPGHLKKDCKGGNVGNKSNGSGTKGSGDGSSNPLKGQNMFNKSLQIYNVTYVSEVYFVQDDDVAWLNIVCDNIGSGFMSISKLNDSILWHARLGHVHFKRMQDMSKDGLIPSFDIDTEMWFWGEAMLTAYYLLNRVPNKKNRITPYELWTKKKPNLNYIGVWGCREAVRLPDPKLKTLGKRGIECIFVGYVKHSTAFRFYVIEPNDSVAINSIIESNDVFFDEHRFSSVPRPSQRSLKDGTKDFGGSVVSERVTEEVVQQPESELRKSKRHRTPKDFGPEFQLYLIEGTKDEISDQHSYYFIIEDDPKTFNEAMKSQDVAFWKEAINDEMDSVIGNNTWVLTNLPLGCRPLGCKWIFKRKLKVDETVEKFKARLVIQGFKQNSGINYFDTYTPVARISTIRLLIDMASIHNLIIHQMDAPKQWHQKFNEVVLSNGYLLNQADKCVYSKIDGSGKGVIIFLYVDDMLIFGTDQVQVDLTKEFLSSRFSMKDMGQEDVILGIRIKHESNGISISQSHYIEKVLKKFNYSDTPVSIPLDTNEKMMPNKGLVSQLEYSRVIGCLMYDMTCTRPDIAFVVGKLSRYTSNPGTQHWQAIQRVLKYLKKTMDYRLVYYGIPAWWWCNLLASKKQTCVTSSTIKSKFVALATAGKEAKWLKNLLFEIPLWLKPMAPISIRCDSVATLANAYSQMYNGKSRHLGVRHSMIRELITNGVRAEAHVLQIITRMCLEPTEKEDEVDNFSMVNVFEKVLCRSMNKEEPPMRCQILEAKFPTIKMNDFQSLAGKVFDHVSFCCHKDITFRRFTSQRLHLIYS